jgi:hypothetical protein
MTKIEVRCRAREAGNWGAVKQRATLAGNTREIRAGDKRVDRARLVAMRQSPASGLDLYMLVSREARVRVMRGQVTMSMWNQFVKETHYKPTGHKAKLLKCEEIDGDRGLVNRADCEAFIEWAKKKTGDQTLRLPNSDEHSAFKRDLAGQLKETRWDRVVSLNDRYNMVYDLLRSLTNNDDSYYFAKDVRAEGIGFRLVGGLPKRRT